MPDKNKLWLQQIDYTVYYPNDPTVYINVSAEVDSKGWSVHLKILVL